MLSLRVLLLGVVFLQSAAAEEVVKTYEDPEFAGTFARILVVGAHADRNVRTMFENSVARALRRAGSAGEPSLTRMGGEALTADTVLAAAHRADADAVMVTRVLDVQTQNSDAATTFTEYWRAYAAQDDPLPIVTTHTVRVRTDLYAVETQSRVWSAESSAFEKNNLFGVIDAIALALTSQLREDALIR